jgi:hypothetical protein
MNECMNVETNLLLQDRFGFEKKAKENGHDHVVGIIF